MKMRGLVVLAVVVAAAVLAAGASATFTPAWSWVPATMRARLAASSGGSLYLPARTPLFYRYRSGAAVHGGALSVTFTNRVRVHAGLWRWTKQSFTWSVSGLPSGTACSDWGSGSQKTFQLAGNKVYSSTGQAWRCVADRHGRTHVLVAADSSGRLPDVGLGLVVASGLDVSKR